MRELFLTRWTTVDTEKLTSNGLCTLDVLTEGKNILFLVSQVITRELQMCLKTWHSATDPAETPD